MHILAVVATIIQGLIIIWFGSDSSSVQSWLVNAVPGLLWIVVAVVTLARPRFGMLLIVLSLFGEFLLYNMYSHFSWQLLAIAVFLPAVAVSLLAYDEMRRS